MNPGKLLGNVGKLLNQNRAASPPIKCTPINMGGLGGQKNIDMTVNIP